MPWSMYDGKQSDGFPNWHGRVVVPRVSRLAENQILANSATERFPSSDESGYGECQIALTTSRDFRLLLPDEGVDAVGGDSAFEVVAAVPDFALVFIVRVVSKTCLFDDFPDFI